MQLSDYVLVETGEKVEASEIKTVSDEILECLRRHNLSVAKAKFILSYTKDIAEKAKI